MMQHQHQKDKHWDGRSVWRRATSTTSTTSTTSVLHYTTGQYGFDDGQRSAAAVASIDADEMRTRAT